MNTYHAIGLMSGTSLDGLDVAYCKFTVNNDNWAYEILGAETYRYDNDWVSRLKNAPQLSGLELIRLHSEYGKYIGQKVNEFLIKHKRFKPEFVASHGHTVFHQPDKSYTFQVGNPASIAAEIKLPVVADFRSLDVALGGQGAPLVPAGDKLLFKEFEFCINLGGFANISFEKNKKLLAFDICPVNYVINRMVTDARIPVKDFFCNNGKGYLICDPDGFIASKGNLNMQLLDKLNDIDFYSKKGPKSLGEEWVNENIWPVINSFNLRIEDALNTFYHHVVMQIHDVVESENGNNVLITGGGAFNKYLVKLLKKHINKKIVIPPKNIIEYKEALIFAFLGLLRILEKENCLSTVTGSENNSIIGGVYIG